MNSPVGPGLCGPRGPAPISLRLALQDTWSPLSSPLACSSIPLAVFSYTQGTSCSSCLLTSQRHLGDLIHAPCSPYAGRPQSSQCLVYIRTDLRFFSTQTRLVISPNMSLLPYSYSREWKHSSSCTEIWGSSLTPLPSSLQVQLLSESYCPS